MEKKFSSQQKASEKKSDTEKRDLQKELSQSLAKQKQEKGRESNHFNPHSSPSRPPSIHPNSVSETINSLEHQSSTTSPSSKVFVDLLLDTPFLPFKHEPMQKVNWESRDIILEEKDDQVERFNSQKTPTTDLALYSKSSTFPIEKTVSQEKQPLLHYVATQEDVSFQIEKLPTPETQKNKITPDEYFHQDTLNIFPQITSKQPSKLKIEEEVSVIYSPRARQEKRTLNICNKMELTHKPQRKQLSIQSFQFSHFGTQNFQHGIQTSRQKFKNHKVEDICYQKGEKLEDKRCKLGKNFTVYDVKVLPCEKTHHQISIQTEQEKKPMSYHFNHFNKIIFPVKKETNDEPTLTEKVQQKDQCIQVVPFMIDQQTETITSDLVDEGQQANMNHHRNKIQHQRSVEFSTKGDYNTYLEKVTNNYLELMKQLMGQQDEGRKRKKPVKNTSCQVDEGMFRRSALKRTTGVYENKEPKFDDEGLVPPQEQENSEEGTLDDLTLHEKKGKSRQKKRKGKSKKHEKHA